MLENITQFTLSDGHIANCHTDVYKTVTVQVCETQGVYAVLESKKQLKEAYRYEKVIRLCLKKIYNDNKAAAITIKEVK